MIFLGQVCQGEARGELLTCTRPPCPWGVQLGSSMVVTMVVTSISWDISLQPWLFICIFKLELQPQVKDSSHFCTTSSGWNLDIVSRRVLQACDTLRDYQALVFTCFMCGWVIYFIASVLQALFFAVSVSSFQGHQNVPRNRGFRVSFPGPNPGLSLGFTAAICQLPATPERSGSFTESPLPPLFRFLSAFSPWLLFGDQGGLTDMILRFAGLQQNMRCMNLCNPGIFFILKTKDNYSIGNNRKCCDIYLYIYNGALSSSAL